MPASGVVYDLIASEDFVRWNALDPVATPVTITYGFAGAGSAGSDYSGFTAFSATERTAALAAFAYIQSFTRITFVEAGSADDAQLLFGNADLSDLGSNVGGVTYIGYGLFGLSHADVLISNTGRNFAASSFVPGDLSKADLGGAGWEVLLHEIGHAIGLKHPFEANEFGDPDSILPPSLDTWANSLMSYTPASHSDVAVVDGNHAAIGLLAPQTYGLYDIAALQYLYGVNGSPPGKTYTFTPSSPVFQTIAVAGQSDKIDCSSLYGPCVIDLRPGATSQLAIAQNLPGWAVPDDPYDGKAALTLGYETLVGRASGGSGNDILIGNSADNTLDGGWGANALYGLDGNDTLVGGSGYSQFWGGDGSDTVSFRDFKDSVLSPGALYADLGAQAAWVDGTLIGEMNSIENLSANSLMFGTATLVGDGGANVLQGGSNTDYLYGQAGDDILIDGDIWTGGPNQLWGGAGSDTVSYANAWTTVYADLGARAGYVNGSLVDLMDSIENLIGGGTHCTLVGDAGANVLTGGKGNCTDYLYGQDGDDLLIGGDPGWPIEPNQLWGGAGNDTASYAEDTYGVYADLVWQATSSYKWHAISDQMNSIENLVGSQMSDVLAGDDGANQLTGGIGYDKLYGRGGTDTFVYNGYADSNLQTGYDTIADFTTGSDTLDFSALHTTAGHVVIASANGSTTLYVEQTPGALDPTTDLALSFVGVNAIAVGDIKF